MWKKTWETMIATMKPTTTAKDPWMNNKNYCVGGNTDHHVPMVMKSVYSIRYNQQLFHHKDSQTPCSHVLGSLISYIFNGGWAVLGTS